ncbi:hypothetical protein KR100_02070 [Synechococcus sp. KORDI-100]|nr:hypothetical protein KR100_02070 [Synechococcus sp. KORDI-100]
MDEKRKLVEIFVGRAERDGYFPDNRIARTEHRPSEPVGDLNSFETSSHS